MFRFELDKSSKKFDCPRCGQKRFVRVLDRETGRCLPPEVGRCDRESSCGYFFSAKDYFASAPVSATVRAFRNAACPASPQKTALAIKPDYIPKEHLFDTLGNYGRNAFVQFLMILFPFDLDKVRQAVKDYYIGTYKDFTVFPKITRRMQICSAKLMKFDRLTGKRLKEDYAISSLQAELKRAGELKQDFETDKLVFFGEHLLRKDPTNIVAIVEAEKTAIIGSILMPEFIWLASGSKSFLKAEKLARLGNRKIRLYPDADGFGEWLKTASEARVKGVSVKVSSLIEKRATGAEKAAQVDICDYLINEQITKLEKYQSFVDEYNAKLETVLNDEALLANVETILEEQKSIFMVSGGLSDSEAENRILCIENFRKIVMNITTN